MAEKTMLDPETGEKFLVPEERVKEATDAGFVLEQQKPGGLNIPGAAGAALTGAGQGASFGFSDELMAAMRTMTPAEQVVGTLAPGLGVGVRMARGALGLETAKGKAAREAALEEERAKVATARKEHPIATGAGELAGAIAPAFIPGVGVAGTAAKVGAGAAKVLPAIARGAATGAAMGGAAGLGYSDAADVGEAAAATAKGAALGGALGGALPAAGAVFKSIIKKVSDIGQKIGPKAAAALTGVGEESARRSMVNPEAVANARELPLIADDILAAIETSKSEAGRAGSEAYNALVGKTVPVVELRRTIDSAIDGIHKRGVSELAKSDIGMLKSIGDQIVKNSDGTDVGMEKLLGLKQFIDDMVFPTPGTTPAYSVSSSISKNALKSVSDDIRKRLNAIPEYEKVMQPQRERVKMLETAYQIAKDEKRLVNTMKRIGREPNSADAKALRELDTQLGTGAYEEILNSMARADMMRAHTTGSAGTLLGATVFRPLASAFGMPADIGSAIGAGIGRMRDVAGGKAMLGASVAAKRGGIKVPISGAAKVRAIEELAQVGNEEPKPASTIQRVQPGEVYYRIAKGETEQTIPAVDWPAYAADGWRVKSEYKPAVK